MHIILNYIEIKTYLNLKMSTTKILTRLRHLMQDAGLFGGKCLEAYIIPSSDSHGSEYPNPKDKRRQFISGFTGSSGLNYVYFV